MKRVLCSTLPAENRPALLDEREGRHLTHVLRLRVGDEVEALDGRGSAVRARLARWGTQVQLEFVEKLTAPSAPEGLPPLRLEMAVIKGEAMEWVIEKAVELGVAELQPVIAAHSVVQLDRKGPEVFRDRWQRIADQALKQCGRLESMPVRLPLSLSEILTSAPSEAKRPLLFCDEASREFAPEILPSLSRLALPLTGIRLLLGPEGGWSEAERKLILTEGGAEIHRVSLGPLVLRAETAAIAAITLVTAALRAGKLREERAGDA